MIALLLAALLSLPAAAQEAGQFNSSCFLGLNDADTPAVIPPCESPTLLNTESNLDGTAILKRKGFSKFADLTISTSPVTGSHSFIDSSGNSLVIVCQDRNCAKSTNGNAFSTFLTTAASGITRWSFVDQGGILYGANNKFDPIMKYDGTTRTSPTGMPLGSILALTQDRLAVGDIQNLPNRVHYSSAGAYEQFTVGVNPEDSFFDDIGADGDRIRGIKCIQGNCLIFKTASITLCEMADQYSTRCSVISPNIGTTDPASIVAAGSSLYFRAQDKNYWEIGRNGLVQISKKIPNLVKSQSGGLGGGENSNTQTTQTDWQNGTQTPASSWNTTTISGSIFPSSTSFVDVSTASFALGSGAGAGVGANAVVQVGFVGVTSTYTARYDATIQPESADPVWSTLFAQTAPTLSAGTMTMTAAGNQGWYRDYSASGVSRLAVFRAMVGGAGTSTAAFTVTQFKSGGGTGAKISLSHGDGGVFYGKSGSFFESGGQNSFSTYTYLISTDSVVSYWRNGVFKASEAVTSSVDSATETTRIQFSGQTNALGDGTAYLRFFYYGDSSAVMGNPASNIPDISTFSSRIFDTALSTPTPGTFVSTQTLPTGTAVTYAVRVSSSPNNDMWDAYQELGATPSRPTLAVKRYWQYKITLKHLNLVDSPGVSGAGLTIATTGQFVAQCIQPNSSISSWGTLSCAQTLTGAGSHVFYATSALTCAALPTTHPVDAAGAVQSGWTAQTNNATVTIATNTAVYIGWRSLLGSATDQAQVDACVLAWNEGTPAQPSWAAYDSVKNAIYWTATVDGASATNRLLKYDRNLEQWYPWDIAAQAPRSVNNTLYFGGAAAGTWNTYGLVDADAGASINSFWTSKDVGGDRPFQEKDFKTLSLLSRNQGTGSLTGTWTNSIGNTGDYTISLSTGAGITYARSNFYLPKKSPQNFMKVRIGNNSSTPFEVLGIGLTWQVLPWRVAP